MLFWKDVGNGILLDCPLPFKLQQSYRPLQCFIQELNPAVQEIWLGQPWECRPLVCHLVCEIRQLPVYPIVFRHAGLPVGGKHSVFHFIHHHVRSFMVAERAQRAANRKSTSKSRKYFQQFDSRWCKCSQHKQIKKHTANTHNTTKCIFFAARFFFWLCCEHLQACAL